MGLPKKTSFEAMLCDASVLKQSYKFELERTKLRIKLDINLCPSVVKAQVTAYKNTSKNKIKYFRGDSKEGVIQLRHEFIQNYPSCVVLPKKENFENYVRSLRQRNHETDSGCRLVYECNSNTNPWRSDLKIKSEPTFPYIPENRYNDFKQNVLNMRDISRKFGDPLKK